MDTGALGKALGRWLECAPRCHHPVVLTTLILMVPAVGAGTGEESAPGSLPAFDQIKHVTVRKQRFFDYLTPVVRAENDRIRRHRRQLAEIAAEWNAGERLGWLQDRYLEWLAEEYRVDAGALSRMGLLDELLKRVDVIPHSLVLVQAAKESAWGSSRFARQANNLFGQWCFEPGCGIVPRRRPSGETHEVRRYDSVRDSVASYMRNLNSHRSYRNFRTLRAESRRRARPLSGTRLAEGLTGYSARGDDYVRELQALIRQNGLEVEKPAAAVTGS